MVLYGHSTVLFLAVLLFACQDEKAFGACETAEQKARANVIARVLRDDNHLFLSRDPTLVTHKLSRMMSDTYDWMRGTVPLWFYDVQTPTTMRPHIALPFTIAQRTTLLVGDPHPENLSTMFANNATFFDSEPALALEWIDLDSATTGPFHLDLRRALQGLILFVGGTTVCDRACIEASTEAMLRAYRDTVAMIERRGAAQNLPPGVMWSSLAREAQEEGLERKKFNTYTDPSNERLSLSFDQKLNRKHKGILPLTRTEEHQVQYLFEVMKSRDESLVLHDAGRRFGQGVSSVPATRFILLVESDRSPKPMLLNVREVFNPPKIETASAGEQNGARNNAHRITLAIGKTWSWPLADPFADAIQVGSQTFKILSWSSYFQSLDHEDIQEDVRAGRLDQTDLDQFASYIGYTLAQAHGRGGSYRSEETSGGLYDAVQTYFNQLRLHLVTAATMDANRAEEDRKILACMIETYGPLAGLYDQMEHRP